MLCGRFTDRRERLGGETPIRFHTVHSRFRYFINDCSGFGWGVDGPKPGGRRWIAVEDRSASKKTRPSILAMLELLSFIEDCCIGVPCVADRRDPMRQKEQAVQLPVNGHDPSLLTRVIAWWQEEQRAEIGHSPFAAPTPAWRAIRQQHRPLRNPDLGLAY